LFCIEKNTPIYLHFLQICRQIIPSTNLCFYFKL